jgi:hypothetical protein
VPGRGLGESVEEHFVGVRMLEGVLEITLARLGHRPGAGEGGEQLDAGVDAKSTENIRAVAITLVKSGSGGAGRLGDAAHGEGFFSPARPEPAGGVKNALFELRIR